jgi:hypothetical protein
MAALALKSRGLGSQTYFNSGLAVECALKAYIMRIERLNSWPSRASRPDLYTHDLRKLVQIAGIPVTPSNPIAAAWNLVMQWDRNQGYDPSPMPRRVALGWFEAAFGTDGAVTWLRMKLT